MVAGCIGDLDESAGGIELIRVFILLESKQNGIVEHMPQKFDCCLNVYLCCWLHMNLQLDLWEQRKTHYIVRRYM